MGARPAPWTHIFISEVCAASLGRSCFARRKEPPDLSCCPAALLPYTDDVPCTAS